MKNIEKTGNAGIKCDYCDFFDSEAPDEKLTDWLGVPCPKCGENLLTQEDLNSALEFDKMIDLINEMDLSKMMIDDLPEELKQFAHYSSVDVNIHNGINLEFKN